MFQNSYFLKADVLSGTSNLGPPSVGFEPVVQTLNRRTNCSESVRAWVGGAGGGPLRRTQLPCLTSNRRIGKTQFDSFEVQPFGLIWVGRALHDLQSVWTKTPEGSCVHFLSSCPAALWAFGSIYFASLWWTKRPFGLFSWPPFRPTNTPEGWLDWSSFVCINVYGQGLCSTDVAQTFGHWLPSCWTGMTLCLQLCKQSVRHCGHSFPSWPAPSGPYRTNKLVLLLHHQLIVRTTPWVPLRGQSWNPWGMEGGWTFKPWLVELNKLAPIQQAGFPNHWDQGK